MLLQKTRTGNNETQNLKTYMDTDGIPNNFFDYISKNGQSTADMLDKVKTYCIHFYLCYFIFFTFTTDSTFCVLNHCWYSNHSQQSLCFWPQTWIVTRRWVVWHLSWNLLCRTWMNLCFSLRENMVNDVHSNLDWRADLTLFSPQAY